METSAKRTLPRLFVHTRLPWTQQKVHRERQEKQLYEAELAWVVCAIVPAYIFPVRYGGRKENRPMYSSKRAVKHFIIAASSGNVHSMVTLRREYTYGNISKEDFAATLRAHQTAMDATKSPQREAGEAALWSGISLSRLCHSTSVYLSCALWRTQRKQTNVFLFAYTYQIKNTRSQGWGGMLRQADTIAKPAFILSRSVQ